MRGALLVAVDVYEAVARGVGRLVRVRVRARARVTVRARVG